MAQFYSFGNSGQSKNKFLGIIILPRTTFFQDMTHYSEVSKGSHAFVFRSLGKKILQSHLHKNLKTHKLYLLMTAFLDP
jgi:hypothetical protein